jgi:hypothetical protein
MGCHDVLHLVSPLCQTAVTHNFAENSPSVPSGGISTFGPLIIKNFGFDKFQTILLNMPFGAVQLIATMGGAWVATKLKWKSPVLAFLSLPPIAGCVMLLHLPRTASAKGPLLVAYYLVSSGSTCTL